MRWKFSAIIVVFLLLVQLSYGQVKDELLPRLSPSTQLYLADIQSGNNDNLKEYVYRKGVDGNRYLSAMIKVTPSVDETGMEKLGVQTGTKAGQVWTVSIPSDKLESFTQLKGIEYIELDQPVAPSMDKVRKVTRTDSVHGGYAPLPMPYTGKNVIVGVIDAGFDYNHPTFRDTTGAQWRIKRVWEQKSSGTPPSGYSYGNEMTDTTLIKNTGTDLPKFSHGTHVAGIAAGSGVGSANNSLFRGIAFASDIVFVGITPDSTQWMNTGMSDIVDGMNYIYDYAKSVGKPSVVNLSWGCTMGPHDGTSLFSQACDALTGWGKVFVCSGGNNGENDIHLGKTFTTTDTIINTELEIGAPLDKTWVDVWGESSKSFCMEVTLYNGSTAVTSTGFVCLDNTTHQFGLEGSDGDTCYVDIVTESSSFNGKPRMFLRFHQKSNNTIYISAKGTDGSINMWNGYVQRTVGYYGSFKASGQTSNATAGNKDMTVGDMADTKSAIAVASFSSKPAYTNLSGSTQNYSGYAPTGALAPYSSIGPSADNRIKPDIAAPGFWVGSGVSSQDTAFTPSGSSASSLVAVTTSQIDNKNYYYAMLTGTSMSGPVVAGIVALMLEVNPNLTADKVMAILKATAIHDSRTGSSSNNYWGHGKVNAFAAVQKALESLDVDQLTGTSSINAKCKVYPNPNNGHCYLEYKSDKEETITIEMLDIAGKKMLESSYPVHKGTNTIELDIAQLTKGIYFSKVSTPTQGSTTLKVLTQ